MQISSVEGKPFYKRVWFRAAMMAAYAALLWGLYQGIVRLESHARAAIYELVTKRKVARIARVPLDCCILGIYRPELPYAFGPVRDLETKIGERFTLISFYQAWGDSEESRFPASLMERTEEEGCVPVLTWEPWVNEFHNAKLRPMPQRERRYLEDIAKGSYDFYISEWAEGATKYGKPFFLRFAHEIGNPRYPWSGAQNRPEDYIRAWWHVRAIFDSVGAKNAIWVWSPFREGLLSYYPGAEHVDWVAMDIFNYGTWAREGDWANFDQLASAQYSELLRLNKPIMIAEAGSVETGGNRAVWYRQMLEQVDHKFTSIKAVIFFANPADRTLPGSELDWSLADPEVVSEIRNGLADDHFSFLSNYGELLTKKGADP